MKKAYQVFVPAATELYCGWGTGSRPILYIEINPLIHAPLTILENIGSNEYTQK